MQPSDSFEQQSCPHLGQLRDMTNRARLLPWPGEDGGPCYLSPEGEGGELASLADQTEAVQLAAGAEVLGYFRPKLDDPAASAEDLRFAAKQLARCLCTVLRVAESRGGRLADGELS
ncbi:hypothetical protein OIE51_15310 [Streptomyces sp. NBC_01803]|nr:hypothetical protein OIE51_10200 [Streptomyces sp. NBC_01803]WSA47632.1 hypothetical protein OIE51_15310 [Streptomyces sp. NBC_01803]